MNLARIRFAAPLLLSLVVVAGCGSSSSSSSSPASSSSSSAAAAPSTSASSTSTAAATGSASTGSAVLISTKHNKLGTILAAGKSHRTVYLFEADKGSSSSCSGACAKAWPPVIGKASAKGKAKASDLGTTSRPDGSTQVTYKGHPLYYFIKDKDAEDAYGQGSKAFGAGWYVLTPSGQKIDKS
jgi:predicted lipoprotein with Yx(FWY)xxD motif